MITRILSRKMSTDVLSKLAQNAEKAEKRLSELKSKLEEVKKVRVSEKIRSLIEENKVLADEIEKAKADLVKIEILNGKKQYPIPGNFKTESTDLSEIKTKPAEIETKVKDQLLKNSKKDEANKKPKEKTSSSLPSSDVIDVRKLDFRIGKIIEINKHPDADSLYVEKIDCGEGNLRTVVSGLVNHVPIEDMRERIVMVLCNLKPVKMRGVTSEAMVMCASSPDKVEVLLPPTGAIPGDLVQCEGYPREPESQLNPKKKIFESCAPDLKTNKNKVACYKDKPLLVPGKGPIVAPTLEGDKISNKESCDNEKTNSDMSDDDED